MTTTPYPVDRGLIVNSTAPGAAPIAPILVRGMALTLHAHHADDLLDMVLPDGWRDVIEEGRAA